MSCGLMTKSWRKVFRINLHGDANNIKSEEFSKNDLIIVGEMKKFSSN